MKPYFAIDGKFSNGDTGFYHSAHEEYPWHMTVFENTMNLTAVKIHNRRNCCGERLHHVQIRAGRTAIDANHSGLITQNTLCGSFDGPGVDAGVYTISCKAPINANVVTIQIVDTGAQYLGLDEVEFLTNGKIISWFGL